jgi:hypothetical protein
MPGSAIGNTSPLKIRLAISGITKKAKVSRKLLISIYRIKVQLIKRTLFPNRECLWIWQRFWDETGKP